MTNKFNEGAAEVTELVKKVAYKDELLTTIKETHEKVQKKLQEVKETNEEIKALLASDLDYFTIEQERKELVKELKTAARAVVKGHDIKPADLIAYTKAKMKEEEAVNKVVQKGLVFHRLSSGVVT